MLVGIGIDIIEIKRIEKALHSKNFLEKCFTKSEIDFLIHKGVNSVAGNFAAKEAISKCLGVGFRGFRPIDIEILRDEYGNPYANLYGKAKQKMDELLISKILVSISHSEKDAIAYATAESNPTPLL